MEEVKGIVEKINPKGVKIDGRWYNYSKYMQENAPKLNEGDEIRVDVNGDWIMRFKSLSRQPSDAREDRTEAMNKSFRRPLETEPEGEDGRKLSPHASVVPSDSTLRQDSEF